MTLEELVKSEWNLKRKLTEKEAHLYLYHLWENGLCNSNFTEDHSEYYEAINFLMNNSIESFDISECQ